MIQREVKRRTRHQLTCEKTWTKYVSVEQNGNGECFLSAPEKLVYKSFEYTIMWFLKWWRFDSDMTEARRVYLKSRMAKGYYSSEHIPFAYHEICMKELKNTSQPRSKLLRKQGLESRGKNLFFSFVSFRNFLWNRMYLLDFALMSLLFCFGYFASVYFWKD